jgi:hypothetical protein
MAVQYAIFFMLTVVLVIVSVKRTGFSSRYEKYLVMYALLVQTACVVGNFMAEAGWFGLHGDVYWPILFAGLLPLCVVSIVRRCYGRRWYACAGSVLFLISLAVALGFALGWPWVMSAGFVFMLPLLVVAGVALHVIDVGIEPKRRTT